MTFGKGLEGVAKVKNTAKVSRIISFLYFSTRIPFYQEHPSQLQFQRVLKRLLLYQRLSTQIYTPSGHSTRFQMRFGCPDLSLLPRCLQPTFGTRLKSPGHPGSLSGCEDHKASLSPKIMSTNV